MLRLALAGATVCATAGCLLGCAQQPLPTATAPPPVQVISPPGLTVRAPDTSHPAAGGSQDALCRNLTVPQRAENPLCR